MNKLTFEIREMLSKALSTPCKNDEYMVDGVKTCCKCNGSKHKWIKVGGIEYLVPVMCRCEEFEWNKIYKGRRACK